MDARGRDARHGRHAAAARAPARLPAPALRRPAPAGHDRDGAGLRAEAADRRRAHDRARRDDPGPDPPPARPAQAGARDGDHPDHPRHGRDRGQGRPRGRHVRRTEGRDAPTRWSCSATCATPTPRRCWPRSPSPTRTRRSRSTRFPACRPTSDGPPLACRFAPRCAFATDRCRTEDPAARRARTRAIGTPASTPGTPRPTRWASSRRRCSPRPSATRRWSEPTAASSSCSARRTGTPPDPVRDGNGQAAVGVRPRVPRRDRRSSRSPPARSSASGSERCTRSPTSSSRSGAARRSGSSASPAAARPRSVAWASRSTPRPPARCCSTASTSARSRAASFATCAGTCSSCSRTPTPRSIRGCASRRSSPSPSTSPGAARRPSAPRPSAACSTRSVSATTRSPATRTSSPAASASASAWRGRSP